ncbi:MULTISPECIES: CCA tRNA nucleotidyltransferase [unclassified Mesorhizobium]|uniref:CCA tRNA nucleotidyltransferase n=1 Tax=unclassified Mesorhizobium TaxID=325217 RepID=UPI0008014B53|nr:MULTISPECIES: CCA tRNA nucleotidyltransferase [unclassified Mesorhizobium]OBQ84341.1 poly(A) polymerase [Mesorhizobium sp. WSM3873]PBB92756.1 CCA tRNA nucleotidyltransferase [Mesorhizobium sp. WSM3864]PBB99340.1 CCA tRNA nucleotidyltransferase [Mesorhizobium sp. WSM3862]
MSAEVSLSGRADWLGEKHLQKLLAALKEGGEEARVAGGAVRNALIGQPVADIDIATTTVPEDTIHRAQAAGFKTVPTGIEHGTVTAIAGGKAYEVTTLRADIETDGRRAKVIFGRDWKADAARRDFTINALYAEADGAIVDLVGGVADIEARRLRFIGDPEARIREDYLRILRFFRFFAWYGDGRPDAEGLKACARLKDGLGRLSAERVWSELKKLLSAPDPSRALLWMRQAGVLTAVLPESEKWGIDAIHGLVRTEKDLGWDADPLLRLEAVVPPDAARMKTLAERLRFSTAEGERLRHWALTVPPEPKTTETELSKKLYFGDREGFVDRLRLALAAARTRAIEDDRAMMEAGSFSRLLGFALKWQKPSFPIKGADLTELGAAPGPKLGATLKNLEREWVDSAFAMDRGALLKRAAQALEA